MEFPAYLKGHEAIFTYEERQLLQNALEDYVKHHERDLSSPEYDTWLRLRQISWGLRKWLLPEKFDYQDLAVLLSRMERELLYAALEEYRDRHLEPFWDRVEGLFYEVRAKLKADDEPPLDKGNPFMEQDKPVE